MYAIRRGMGAEGGGTDVACGANSLNPMDWGKEER